MITAVDTNILLDLFLPDLNYAKDSKEMLKIAYNDGALIICDIVYAELVPQFLFRKKLDEILKIVNISDPANPSIGDEFYSGYIPAVSVNGTYAYVQDFLNGLHIFDISDPYSADEVGNCETVYWASSITAYGDYAYIAGGINRCMQIVDVSDPENPIPFGRFFLPGGSSSKTNEIAVSGHLVFVANGLTGLMVIDVSNPENPFLVCSFDTAGFAEDIFIQGDKIYVADGDSGKLYVLQLNIDTTTYIEMNLNNVLYLLNNFSSSITNIETLKSKIDVVIKGIQNGNYNGTYSKLKHDILEKMDGCATNGAPDRNDWVTDCAAQNELYPKVKQCLDLIAGLKKP